MQGQQSSDLQGIAAALLTASGSVEWDHLLEYADPPAGDGYAGECVSR